MTQAIAPTKPRSTLLRVLHWIFWIAVLGLIVRFLGRNALHYLVDYTEASYGPFWARRSAVLVHVIGGFVALALGPLQFWTGTCRRAMGLHRITGRLYLGSILLGSAAAFYLSLTADAFGPAWGLSLFVLALVWLTSSIMGLVALRCRRVDIHVEWMVRSYVVTFGFVTFRLLSDSNLLAKVGTPGEQASTAVWLAWAVPLFVAELVMQGRKLMR